MKFIRSFKRGGLKGLTCIIIIVATVCLFLFPSHAAVNDTKESSQLEVVNIGGTNYSYSYDNANPDELKITNLQTNTTNILTFDQSSGKVFLNGEQCATISDPSNEIDLKNQMQPLKITGNVEAKSIWKKIGTTGKHISWKKNTPNAVLAGIMSAVLGYKGSKATLIASIGYSLVQTMASEGGSCTLTATVYKSVAGQAITYKYVGHFTFHTKHSFTAYAPGQIPKQMPAHSMM